MANYSQYASSETIATDIILSRRRYNGTYVIVEGQSDFRVLSKEIDKNHCKIQPVGGKKKVKEILQFLESKNRVSGVVGIVDQDYTALDNSNLSIENLINIDVHDLESLIFQSDAFEKVLEKRVDFQKLEKFEKVLGLSIREVLLKYCAPISILKYLSNKYHLEIDFKTFDDLYDQFFSVNNTTLSFNLEKMIEIAQRNTRTPLNPMKLKGEIINLCNLNIDLWLVCCGHQLVRVFSLVIEKSIGKRTNRVNPSDIEEELYMSYEIIHFVQTDLYKELVKWEKTNTSYKILLNQLHLVAQALQTQKSKFKIIVLGKFIAREYNIFNQVTTGA